MLFYQLCGVCFDASLVKVKVLAWSKKVCIFSFREGTALEKNPNKFVFLLA